ncbi:MAG: ATP-binding cassette domain-containing protein [Duodenibacillus sp.]|nr:ATP-binding cassette domain-containing protein [Duodenibacillus sp.]
MLVIDNVHKTFFPGSPNEKKALCGVQLTLNDGDFVTVIGSNGAGKSTMLNAIAGVFPVDRGRVVINGRDITGESEHRRARYIGRVFQDPMKGTAAGMMIEENLAMASRRGRMPGFSWSSKPRELAHFRELLAELDLGLENRMTARVGLLSGGQRQALTLLMATLVRPELLLLDEHTAALDPKTAAKVLAMEPARLQSYGLSWRKVEYIRDFARKVAAGEFDLAAVRAMDDAAAVAALSSLKGVGVWTAEMILLFCLRRPDVFSYGDFGIRKGVRMVYRHRELPRERFERYRRRFSPYGSVASLYFWAVAGGALPELDDPAPKENR